MCSRNREAKFRSLEHDQQKWTRFSDKIMFQTRCSGGITIRRKSHPALRSSVASARDAAGGL
jgi:hypothetical protein